MQRYNLSANRPNIFSKNFSQRIFSLERQSAVGKSPALQTICVIRSYVLKILLAIIAIVQRPLEWNKSIGNKHRARNPAEPRQNTSREEKTRSAHDQPYGQKVYRQSFAHHFLGDILTSTFATICHPFRIVRITLCRYGRSSLCIIVLYVQLKHNRASRRVEQVSVVFDYLGIYARFLQDGFKLLQLRNILTPSYFLHERLF